MIFAEQRGTNTALDVVMIHGTPSAPASMWHIGDALTDIARVTNVHLPGYGQSPALHPYDSAKALDLTEDALARAGVRAPVILGYSSGARRAFALALRPSVSARGVVSLSGVNELSPEHCEALRANAGIARNRDIELAPLFTPFFVSPNGMENPAVVAEVGTWFDCIDRDDMADELEDFTRSVAVDIAGLAIPVLARVGALDQAAPVALTEALVRGLPNATMQVVPGVGHAIMLEDQRGDRGGDSRLRYELSLIRSRSRTTR